jgi:phosphoribosylformylglycinamidine synthase
VKEREEMSKDKDFEALCTRGAVYGLGLEECRSVDEMMGRTPREVELAVIGAMWSEHCSYKTSRKWLSRLPGGGEEVVCGPGENAGVVSIGGGYGVAFKIESHNHPSVIVPYQGAATGVGGILRDVFTMGARPIALLNSLWFGGGGDEKTSLRMSGVVRGIGGYGNSIGVPTVAGETGFHDAYKDNIVMNAMAVGLVRLEELKLSQAGGVGNVVVYVGGSTGRDGVKGAVMASAGFEDGDEFERTTVQVADPFCGKRLLEACMEVVKEEGLVAMQDMGAAGLTSSSVEMSDKGGVGMELWLDCVPLREGDMQPHEIMLSESQERMLLVVEPDSLLRVCEIFRRHDLEAVEVGCVREGGDLRLLWEGEEVGCLPLSPLASLSPLYDRERKERPSVDSGYEGGSGGRSVEEVLKGLLGGIDLCSRREVWEQYDRFVGGRLLSEEGGDAGVLDIRECGKGLAVSLDSKPRYGAVDARSGGRAVVCEVWRNLVSVGSRPLALTDNLNAGNPEDPYVMHDFVETIEGMREASLVLGLSFVSGNVSLYNETEGRSIPPTPVVGGVGILEDVTKRVSHGGACEGWVVMSVGVRGSHLGASLYAHYCSGERGWGKVGRPPYGAESDILRERVYGEGVRRLIEGGVIGSCHDVGDGGMLVALVEMLLASGKGAELDVGEEDYGDHGFWFGEDGGRYVVMGADEGLLREGLEGEGLAYEVLGIVKGRELVLKFGAKGISLEELQFCVEGGLEQEVGWHEGF